MFDHLHYLELAVALGCVGLTVGALLKRSIQGHIFERKCKAFPDLKGFVALVTGGNSGIGLEVAVGLAQRGAEVIIACRSEASSAAAVKTICMRSGSTLVSSTRLDLADLQSVRDMANTFLATGKPLHILVANAGIHPSSVRTVTKDGHEVTLQSNYLGHFLLIKLLLEHIKQSAKEKPARIVEVASSYHHRGRILWDDIEMTSNYDPDIAYCQSKLAVVLHTKELQRRLEGKSVVAVSCDPGFTRTKIIPLPALAKAVLYPLFLVIGRTPWSGAQTVLHCALDPTVVGGKYYNNCQEEQATGKAGEAKDPAAAARLWELTEELLSKAR